MIWDGDPVATGRVHLDDDVAPLLVDSSVAEGLPQTGDKPTAGQIARELHSACTTSSRTRWRRIRSGGAESKWKLATASTTYERSSSHVSPWAKISSLSHSAVCPPPAASVPWKTSSPAPFSFAETGGSSVPHAAGCSPMTGAHQEVETCSYCCIRLSLVRSVAFSSRAVAAMIWSAGSVENGCGSVVER